MKWNFIGCADFIVFKNGEFHVFSQYTLIYYQRTEFNSFVFLLHTDGLLSLYGSIEGSLRWNCQYALCDHWNTRITQLESLCGVAPDFESSARVRYL